jgi:broad specificity phosphatase PhoE
LILVRHGQTNGNVEQRWQGWSDTPLNELGHWQAVQAARRLVLQKGRIAALYSSPLSRAYETAKPIACALDLPIHIVEGLKEFHFGVIEGLTTPEFQARFPEVYARSRRPDDSDFAYPGGESRTAFFRRVSETMDCIVARHPNESVVIVAHGGTLRAALAHYLPDRRELWQDFTTGHCSLTYLCMNGYGVKLGFFNSQEHLQENVDI